MENTEITNNENESINTSLMENQNEMQAKLNSVDASGIDILDNNPTKQALNNNIANDSFDSKSEETKINNTVTIGTDSLNNKPIEPKLNNNITNITNENDLLDNKPIEPKLNNNITNENDLLDNKPIEPELNNKVNSRIDSLDNKLIEPKILNSQVSSGIESLNNKSIEPELNNNISNGIDTLNKPIEPKLNNDISNGTNLLDNNPVNLNIVNTETIMNNTQKPPIIEEKKKEMPDENDTFTSNNTSPSVNNTQNQINISKESVSNFSESISTLPETSTIKPVASPAPSTPELTTRKSFKNLSKEEKLRRQRELRKKKILASSQERLSRITKTYSQGSSYYNSSDRDDSSLSKKSSSRSVHHRSIDRVSPSNLNTSNNDQINEHNNSQITNDQSSSNINDLSRNSSVNSINSLKINSEVISRDITNIKNNGPENIENNPNNSEIPSATIADNNNVNDSNTDIDSETNASATNNQMNDFARLLFREMLKEEFNKDNNQYRQTTGTGHFNNLSGPNDFKNGMDTILSADKPFETLGKMFDFLNVDEKTSEEQRIADEKYKQYYKLSKLIHTAVIFVYSFLVVLISIRAVHITEDYGIVKRNFIGNFFYRLSNSDTLSQGKTIFGMTPWTCLVLLEFTLLAGQLGYQYAFNIKKETWKEFDLIPIPIVNKIISLINQYKLYIEIFVNDLFLYLFIIGFSVSIGKIFY